MHETGISPQPQIPSLRNYRFVLVLFVSIVTASYLCLEFDVIFTHSRVDSRVIHLGFAVFVWLLGLAGVQYGYDKIRNTAAALSAERNSLLAIFDAVQVGMLLVNDQMIVVQVNQSMSRQYDTTPEGRDNNRHGTILRCPIARNPLGCGQTAECNSCSLMLALQQALQDGVSSVAKEAMLHCERDGEVIQMWILFSVKPLVLDGKRFALLSLMDVTERKDAETHLRSQKETYRALVENVPDIIIRYDQSGRRLYANPAYERLIGGSSESLIGKTPGETPVFGQAISEQVQRAILDVLNSGQPKQIEMTWESQHDVGQRYYAATYVPEFDAENKVASVLCISRDISEIRAFQHQLQHMVFFDALTKLPNRVLFNDRLEQLIADMSRGEQTAVGVMFLDLDGFKAVNDTLGHNAGDELLCEAGNRIRACLRDYDTVARLGGDEFAVILPELRQELDLAAIARKILTTIDEPFYIAGKELFITTSIGVACYPSDSIVPAELLSFADAAMYHAKAMGRNNCQYYSASLTRDAGERMELESDLRKALQQDEFEVYYQPKVDTIIGLLVGCEALLRWNHPVRGQVPPDKFIGIAEDAGLITSIGAWVLETACSAAVEWNRDAHFPLKVAVNLSVRQFMSENLVETICRILVETGCRPEWLELEITESLLMSHKSEIIAILDDLSTFGITIAIDDFGTGYSALSYLTDFPISTIKIDKSFVQNISIRRKDMELVKAIVSMGHALGLELVAEGVETGEQAVCLDKLGCHVIQGYLYAKPMPIRTFNDWRVDFFNSRQLALVEDSELEQSSWRDYLATGNIMIDAQHRELFKRITKLSIACRAGKGQDEVTQLLDYLGGYVKTHFCAEEALLISVDSPYYTEHKAAHDKFIAVIDMLSSRYRQGGETLALTVETNYVAVDWLTKHICTMDRDLADRLHMSS